MFGIVLIVIAIIFIGVGSQAKREGAIERAQGLPAGKGLTGTPFYVVGALLGVVGVLLLTGVLSLNSILK